MTDPIHLNEFHATTTRSLSRKLVEAFRDAARDPALTKADQIQRLKDEMEAALQEEQPNAAHESDDP